MAVTREEFNGSKDPRGDRAVAGYVSEIFCSVQGEGIYLGERQLFLRMGGCTATCYWCDTVASKEELPACTIHGRSRRSIPNPMLVAQTVHEVFTLLEEFAPVQTVSITGGEPLEQSDFVAEVAKELRHQNVRVYLETNGLEVEGLKKVRPYADVVAMDIKLPYATGKAHWEQHREFLKWLVGKKAFVKVVVDDTTPLKEIEGAVHLIAEVDRGFPLVIQPESTTYLKGGKGAESRKALARLLEESQRIALQSLRDVRVIPQCHKILKVR